MAFDLVPRRFLSFPTLPSIWDEDEDWLTMPSTPGTGLSISEDEKNIYVEGAVPGIDPDDIEVTYQDGYVWIHGETKSEEKDKKRKFYRQSAKSFSYRVAVPGDVDPNVEPEATYKNGVMTVTFAKSPKSQPKKVKVKRA
jgi:HSP20 family protein